MGAWGCGIRDSDTALDVEGLLSKALGLCRHEASPSALKALNDNKLKLAIAVESQFRPVSGDPSSHQDNRIFWMVFGYWILRNGAKMPAAVAKKVRAACTEEIALCEIDSDGWVHPEERIHYCKALLNALDSYTGKPVTEEVLEPEYTGNKTPAAKTVLCWDKPKRAMPVEDWKGISADSAPPGVYVPNMSDADRKKWKAKLVGTKTGHPQVEIRKSAGSEMLIIVSLKGVREVSHRGDRIHKGVNIKMSMNGPAMLSFQDAADLQLAINEAHQKLENL